jgi:hypothetical protein
VYPGAPERCDLVANDCDTRDAWSPDDEEPAVRWSDGGPWIDVTHTFSGEVELASGTWEVCRGTWDVSLTVTGLDVVLYGIGGATLTGGGTHRVLDVAPGAHVAVHELALVDGATDGSGGLVRVGVTARSSIHGCSLARGTAADGGCLAVEGGTATLQSSSATACTATGNGGGVMVSLGMLDLYDVTIEDSEAARGGGIAVGPVSQVRLSWSTVRGNRATTGGGVHGTGGTLTCGAGGDPASRIVGNVASDVGRGAGVYLDSSGPHDPVFVADVCDLGASGSVDDNVAAGDPPTADQDVVATGATYRLGDRASLVCSGKTGCGTP